MDALLVDRPQSNLTGAPSAITALQAQKQDINSKLTAAHEQLTEAGSDRQSCKRKIGWNNGCLDRNNALQNTLRSDITNYQQRLVELDAEITSATAQYNAQQKAEAESLAAQAAAQARILEAQAAANPATAQYRAELEAKKIETEQQKNASDSQANTQKLLIYAGAGVLCLAIVAVVVYLIKGGK